MILMGGVFYLMGMIEPFLCYLSKMDENSLAYFIVAIYGKHDIMLVVKYNCCNIQLSGGGFSGLFKSD